MRASRCSSGTPASRSGSATRRDAARRGRGLGSGRAGGVPGRRSRSWPAARRGCHRRRARRAAGSTSGRSGGRSRGAAACGSGTADRRGGRGARSSCWIRRRTSSTAAKPRWVTWKLSSTRVAAGSPVRSAAADQRYGSSDAAAMLARQPGSRCAIQLLSAGAAALDDVEQPRHAAGAPREVHDPSDELRRSGRGGGGEGGLVHPDRAHPGEPVRVVDRGRP